MTTDVVAYTPEALQRSATAAEIRSQVNLIQEVMKAVMKDGTHYGTIPGTPKPTLYKPGSEKILSTFHIAIEPVVTDLSVPGEEARFRVETRATSQGSGAYLGSGIGEASSLEEKYKWRKAVCPEEFNETPEDRRRRVWKKGDRGAYQIDQVRTQPADVANTILKMAKKRSQIDVTLTVTAASDVFAQDIEDVPEEMREVADDSAPAKPAAAPAQRVEKPAAKPAAGAGTVTTIRVKDITKKEGHGDKGPWVKTTVLAMDGHKYGTFDTEMARLAREAFSSGASLEVSYTESKYGRDIQTLAFPEPGANG